MFHRRGRRERRELKGEIFMHDTSNELRYFDKEEEIPKGYNQILDDLQAEAKKILEANNNQPVIVNKNNSIKLYYWNRSIRKKKKLRKIQKLSRKINR